MKTIEIRLFVFDPLELTITDLQKICPDEERYLVKIFAWGVNFFDMLQVCGKYQEQRPFPWIAGMEFAGIIVDISKSDVKTSDVTTSASSKTFNVGDRVFGSCRGAYASHILVPSGCIIHIPSGWSFKDAAGLHVSVPTAYAGLVTRGKIQSGEWALTHAGAGAAGLSAIQIAKALGATVIATAGSPRKCKICQGYRADYVIKYREKDWTKQIIGLCEQHREGNGRKGVDVVLDPVVR
ncbi:NADPH2:quinone reductase [Penicillium maclennaniae]|uniref:NADPH2:quinone reductase n=1 Tax=Penicillium maclennaniae TaxID=1343394 RepID=UPI002540BFC4|nr:NADPH2:quinone reductase [Penicillium maclennaniae]KAJ5675238.1 NADPH2:quinone reductase [Penicillium maclennaniae]